MKILVTLGAVLMTSLGMAATQFVWDGASTSYGGIITVTYDGNGKVTSLDASVASDEEVSFTGDVAAAFAKGAVIGISAPGSLTFANPVETLGEIEVVGASGLTLEGDDGFIPNQARLIPNTKGFNPEDIEIVGGGIAYKSGDSTVELACSYYHAKTEAGGVRTVQIQNWNGAWTRCVKIEISRTDEGLSVRHLYSKMTSVVSKNILGADFDENLPDVRSDSFFLRNLGFALADSDDLCRVAFTGVTTFDGAIKVSSGACAEVTGEAIGALGNATCMQDVVFNDGSFTFLDCGKFMYAGAVSGNKGKLIFKSTDGNPTSPSTATFEGTLTDTDQIVLRNTSVQSITGTTAVVRYLNYNGSGTEVVMYDEYRGNLRNAFFRNVGQETVVRYQARNDSLAYSVGVCFSQAGNDVVARKVMCADYWISQSPKSADPWTWDPVNDPMTCDPRYLAMSYAIVSNVTFSLSGPVGAVDQVTDVTLSGSDSSTAVAYVFKPGANRQMVAEAKALTSVPQTSGELVVHEGATLVLSCTVVQDTAAMRYSGLWQNGYPAKITVHPGGRMLTDEYCQNHGQQSVLLDASTYEFRTGNLDSTGPQYYLFKSHAGSGASYLGNVTYRNGARTSGYNIGLSGNMMFTDPLIKVEGIGTSVADHGFFVWGSAKDAEPAVLTFDVDDVTGDAKIDFVLNGLVQFLRTETVRLCKTGSGSMYLGDVVNLPGYKVVLESGAFIMGCTNCLSSTDGVSLRGGVLGTTEGLRHEVGGGLELTADSGLMLASGSMVAFGDSSSEVWTPGARLDIVGDSETGAVYFGSDVSGLTESQLRQIRFNGKRVTLTEEGRLNPYVPGMCLIVR